LCYIDAACKEKGYKAAQIGALPPERVRWPALRVGAEDVAGRCAVRTCAGVMELGELVVMLNDSQCGRNDVMFLESKRGDPLRIAARSLVAKGAEKMLTI
jgi:hypothetical protein